MTTRREAVRTAADFLRNNGVEDASAEASALLARVLDVPIERVLLEDVPVEPSTLARFNRFVERRGGKREPFAYIAGTAWFYGNEFEVSPSVLLPRPSTETLVERALEIPAKSAADIGTGSGILAITLALLRPDLALVATEVSDTAMAVARRNALRHKVANRIDFRPGSLLEPLARPVDLLVSNPPYIRRDVLPTLSPEVRHEPAVALDGGIDGLDLLRTLISTAPAKLNPAGTLLVEIGYDQSDAVRSLAQGAGFRNVRLHRDLDGIDRVLEAS